MFNLCDSLNIYTWVQCLGRCCSLPTCQLLASWSSRTACHTTSSPMTRSSSSTWTAPTPRRPSTGSPTARPQFDLVPAEWPAAQCWQVRGCLSRHPCSAPVSYQHHHRRRCWKHSASCIAAQVAWCNHIPTCGSTVMRETLQRSATSTLALCATCAVD